MTKHPFFTSVISESSPNSFVVSNTSLQHTNKPLDLNNTEDFLRWLKLKQPRTLSEVGSASYQRSLRRSFNRAKLIAFFNPDINQFITLTYKGTTHTPHDVMNHIKQFIKEEKRRMKMSEPPVHESSLKKQSKFQNKESFPHADPTPKGQVPVVNSEKSKLQSKSESSPKHTRKKLKYIWVMEYQKRGSLHVHMITNDFFQTHINKYGYEQLTNWKHGFTQVQTVENTDENFKPYLYLFKYMHKSQRIGSSFIHVSRGLDKIKPIDYNDIINKIDKGELVYKEESTFKILDKTYPYIRDYIRLKDE